MCGGAFQIHRKKRPWNYVMCPSIDKQILCGWGRCFQIQRKKNLEEVLYDYMMQHPTYASIIHLCIIIHSKPQYESAGNE